MIYGEKTNLLIREYNLSSKPKDPSSIRNLKNNLIKSHNKPQIEKFRITYLKSRIVFFKITSSTYQLNQILILVLHKVLVF
jgi:hypothetical protein